jgi:hypothetical protein
MSMWERFTRRLPKGHTERELEEKFGDARPEREDYKAMLIAAFITIGPFVLVVALLVLGAMWLMFGR